MSTSVCERQTRIDGCGSDLALSEPVHLTSHVRWTRRQSATGQLANLHMVRHSIPDRLQAAAQRGAVDRAYAIAGTIRYHQGDVWPAVTAYGISYSHACRIRAGWRPGGIRALPIPYQSRGWVSGRRTGYSTLEQTNA